MGAATAISWPRSEAAPRCCALTGPRGPSTGSSAAPSPTPILTPTPTPNTEYLELVGDAAGEFCGQHHVTLTEWDSVVLFDNGVFCLGPRKAEAPFTRAVEYDISSATQAVFVQAFEQPLPGHGYSDVAGSVTVLETEPLVDRMGQAE